MVKRLAIPHDSRDAATFTHGRPRGGRLTPWAFLQSLYLRFAIWSDERYLATCRTDDLVKSLDQDAFRRRVGALRARLALLYR